MTNTTTKRMSDAQYERIVKKLDALGFWEFGTGERNIDGTAVSFSMGNYPAFSFRTVREVVAAQYELSETYTLVRAEADIEEVGNRIASMASENWDAYGNDDVTYVSPTNCFDDCCDIVFADMQYNATRGQRTSFDETERVAAAEYAARRLGVEWFKSEWEREYERNAQY